MAMGANLRDEHTVFANVRIPESIAEKAWEIVPDAQSMSAIIRVALAKLVGVDSDQFLTNLRDGRKPRKTSLTQILTPATMGGRKRHGDLLEQDSLD